MPKVRFVNVGLEVDVAVGTTILEAARQIDAPAATRCGGVCACSACHVKVLTGEQLLSEATAAEREMLELAARERGPGSRLGCQARLLAEGCCEVIISHECFRAFLDDHPADRDRAMQLWLAGHRKAQ